MSEIFGSIEHTPLKTEYFSSYSALPLPSVFGNGLAKTPVHSYLCDGVNWSKIGPPVAVSVTASRNAARADADDIYDCNSSSNVVITLLSDILEGYVYGDTHIIYWRGTGTPSFAVDSGMPAIKGSAPTVARGDSFGVWHSGTDEWSWL